MDSVPPPGLAPIWTALRGDAAQLEIRVAWIQMVVALFALGIALYFWLLIDSPIGPPFTAFAAWILAWFALASWGMRRGRGLELFGLLNPMVEIAIPAVALALLAHLQGPEYALGSWVPSQMFALLILASILRLRPAVPLAMGVVGALEYGLVYLFVLRPAVGPQDVLWSQPRVQLVRMLTLMSIGLAGTLAVHAFRRMVLRAEGEVRSRELFGKYRLGEIIASGGMGTVYRATYCPEGGFERPVAVKQIHPHLARDRAFVERFRQEARIGSRLAHPNIVGALDFGRVGSTYFYAMEFVDGATLKELLVHHQRLDRPIEPRVVCWLLRQVATGLEYAHDRAVDDQGRRLRVVHRDLSPQNVLIDRGGWVKLSDFGVARALRQDRELHTASVVGKPAYMAPEQLRQGAIDARSDLFGLGVIAWEALTNRRLFYRENDAATILAVIEDPAPSPSAVDPRLGPHWDRLCHRALAKAASERFQSAAELKAALDAIQPIEGRTEAADLARLVEALG